MGYKRQKSYGCCGEVSCGKEEMIWLAVVRFINRYTLQLAVG